MTTPPRSSFLLALAGCLCAAQGPCQRDIVAITKKAEVHQDAKISPDGSLVVFRGPKKIGVVASAGGAEGVLASGLNIGDFFWAPTGSGVYFVENNEVRFVAKGGGNPKTIAKLPGLAHRLWCVDSKDNLLYGTRLVKATRQNVIFSLATNGASPVKDLISSAFVMDEVHLDLGETRLLFRKFSPQPFQPREYLSSDLTGKNIVSLTGKAISGQPQDAHWVDAGKSIVFTMISPKSNTWQVARVGPSSTSVRMLTEGMDLHRGSVVSADGRWVLHQASGQGMFTVALVPSDGGGVIRLGADGKVYQLQGSPSIDRAGKRVVFAATVPNQTTIPQVFRVDLDREMRVSPRVEVGKSFSVAMPITNAEVGGIFLSNAVTTKIIKIPGHRFGIALNPLVLVLVVSGKSTTGTLGVSVAVPNNPSMIGQSLFFQGLRTTGSAGDFTRTVEFRIF